MYPTRASLRRETSPASGSTFPARISSNVDLPEPFGPTTPIWSPSETVKAMLSNNGLAPYALRSDCPFRIGGKRTVHP